jgi:hypothetical protein
MFRSFLTFGSFFVLAACPAAAQSDAPVPSVQTDSTATSSTPATTSTKKVWTNENFNGSATNPPVAGKQSQKNAAAGNSQHRAGDPATAARIKQSLQKLQTQLVTVNLKLENYKKFLEGETVSDPGRDPGKGYSRTPVDQQMAALQEKKKQLELQIDVLYEEARKKEIEPGQLR